ncbi:redox-sensing transcriptional repressor Rex [Desulfolutivibrio sulfoxidireducens]|uniref:redox-sensing transcriptional repressor Rex n=1 Tax=Desulfolutivibrio sulfoxidireducens TaxID=2773299 RepID=UPI00159DCAB2|nr:redox-sensing transcriptional repressor Rex [Desulfolutivibrio sulfoxidireducens]QLA17960.1 redox-sensing transcriptional repressor Rex [Desulfolutivibrio sulfoxidireducens]QLA21539.1 redox-sensing transcriptional repressor Rex [Desulfolutivibrio sulfoxidireducens]
MKSDHIPRATIKRLAMYVQVLESFKREGTQVVSSELLARTCNVNPSQIRKDLAYFGEFGVRGVGYHVQDLITAIKRSLGVDRMWKCALVGVGNLGNALLRHREFKYRGFDIVAAFDCDPFKIGEEVMGLEVVCTRRLKDTAKELGIEIGLITTPPDRAQRAANFLVEAGMRGIINFAPARITVPADVNVEYVDFFHHLYAVSFSITLDQRSKAQDAD